ncbi:MAG: phage protein Gp27 family protein [Desulfovibrionaceae bacterium]
MAKTRRKGRGRPSTIDLLPEDLRVELHAALREKKLTQGDIAAAMNRLLEERGLATRISKSALNRYSLAMEERSAQLREAREAADAIVAPLEQVGHTDLGRAVTEVVKSLAFDFVVKADTTGEPISIDTLKSLAIVCERMEKASKTGVEREIAIREEAKRAALEKAAKVAAEVSQEAGLGQHGHDWWVEKFLGVQG